MSVLAEERQQEILRVMRARGGVSVSALIRHLNTSSATVRRDLGELEARNLIRRTRGGAVPVSVGGTEDPGFPDRAVEQVAEKRAIAVEASRLVKPGLSIGLDAGTTVDSLAHILTGVSPLTVVTNSLAVAARMGDAPGITVVMTGGALQWTTQSLIGPLAEATLAQLTVDLAFMTARGINPQSGAMNTNMNSAGVKKAMVTNARQIVVLADHTKFERTGLISVVPPERIDTLITDWLTPEERLAPFREMGVRVISAPPVQ